LGIVIYFYLVNLSRSCGRGVREVLKIKEILVFWTNEFLIRVRFVKEALEAIRAERMATLRDHKRETLFFVELERTKGADKFVVIHMKKYEMRLNLYLLKDEVFFQTFFEIRAGFLCVFRSQILCKIKIRLILL